MTAIDLCPVVGILVGIAEQNTGERVIRRVVDCQAHECFSISNRLCSQDHVNKVKHTSRNDPLSTTEREIATEPSLLYPYLPAGSRPPGACSICAVEHIGGRIRRIAKITTLLPALLRWNGTVIGRVNLNVVPRRLHPPNDRLYPILIVRDPIRHQHVVVPPGDVDTHAPEVHRKIARKGVDAGLGETCRPIPIFQPCRIESAQEDRLSRIVDDLPVCHMQPGPVIRILLHAKALKRLRTGISRIHHNRDHGRGRWSRRRGKRWRWRWRRWPRRWRTHHDAWRCRCMQSNTSGTSTTTRPKVGHTEILVLDRIGWGVDACSDAPLPGAGNGSRAAIGAGD